MISKLDIKTFDEISSHRPKVYCKDFIPLQEGSPVMMCGGGGTGKTYGSIRMAIEYALETGKKVALWLTEDPPGETKFRFMSICREFYPQHYSKIIDQVRIINSPPLRFTKLEKGNAVITEDFLRTRLELADYGMVVIDPLIQFNGCDENSNSHAGVMMGGIKAWANEENKVLVLIHHITINDHGVKARGAGEWSNACRAVYLVGKPSEGVSKDHLKFTLTKNNGIAWCFKNDKGDLVRELRIFPPWRKEEQIPPTSNKLFLSIATHNSAKKPDGFIRVEVDYFYEVHKLVTSGKAYSQYDFNKGYRLGDNNQGKATMICLDFDDGMTIEQAKKKFAKIQSLIVTTRSHQVEKSGQKCDRFRVIMPLDSPLSIPLSDYPDFLDCLSEATGGEVDPSTKDLARFYFASPDDAIYHYSDSEKRLNWRLIYDKMKKDRVKRNLEKKIAEQSRPQRTERQHRGEPQNTLPKNTMFETKNGAQSFEGLRASLSTGAKEPCKCIEGIDHGSSGRHHMSAFVKKDSNGNVFYSCSGGRCAGKETKWCAD